MHKSTTIAFGLLLSSLVMLAAMPVFNQQNNLFSNTAVAQGYDAGYGDNYYSHYPTDDKKYECRTGPFEGFFVSSVEFCKQVKFDDNKRDRDSKIGPPGPPGPQGIQGIQGPPGPNGTQGPQGQSGIITLNDTNTYIVSTSFTDVNASSDESLVAICDLEDSIINGGYETDTDPNNRFQIRSDVQFPFPPTNMWFVNIQNIGDNPLLFLVYATCFDNPPTHIP